MHNHILCIFVFQGLLPSSDLSLVQKIKRLKDYLDALFLQLLSCIPLSFYLFLFYFIKANSFKEKKNVQRTEIQRKKTMIFTLPRISLKRAEVERRNDVSTDEKERRDSGVSSLKWVLDQTIVISNLTVWVFAQFLSTEKKSQKFNNQCQK